MRNSACSSEARGPACARAKIAAAGSRSSSSSAIRASSRPASALARDSTNERTSGRYSYSAGPSRWTCSSNANGSSSPSSSARPRKTKAPRQKPRSVRCRLRCADGHPSCLLPRRLRSCLTAGTPVGGAVGVALAARAHDRAAATTGPPRAPVHADGPVAPVATDSCISRRAASRASRNVSSLASAQAHPRRDPHLPERLRHPHVPDPGDEALVLERLAEAADLRAPRSRATAATTSNSAASTSWPSPRTEPSSSASTGPFQSTPSSRRRGARATAAPTLARPRGSTRQRPVIRRWLRTTTPPSNRSRRFLPTASTDSSTRPSIRDATPVTCARGCGDSASIRWPTSACSRAQRDGANRPRARPEGSEPQATRVSACLLAYIAASAAASRPFASRESVG